MGFLIDFFFNVWSQSPPFGFPNNTYFLYNVAWLGSFEGALHTVSLPAWLLSDYALESSPKQMEAVIFSSMIPTQ